MEYTILYFFSALVFAIIGGAIVAIIRDAITNRKTLKTR